MRQIILASASPRRRELLEQIGLEFEICPAKGEEVIHHTEPEDVVIELSEQKAKEVAAMIGAYGEKHAELMTPQEILVIGADTIVACDGKILGKPKDEADACRMLSLLSGRRHSVYTGVAFVLLDASGKAGMYSFFEKTDVFMKELSEKEIRRYAATGEPLDKAGAYGIQGKGAAFVERIEGDYNNVVGLPLARVYKELLGLGMEPLSW